MCLLGRAEPGGSTSTLWSVGGCKGVEQGQQRRGRHAGSIFNSHMQQDSSRPSEQPGRGVADERSALPCSPSKGALPAPALSAEGRLNVRAMPLFTCSPWCQSLSIGCTRRKANRSALHL